MADNVGITTGADATIATDDVAGVQFQRVKLVDGTADSSAAIPGDATNGLDVDVTRVQGTVAISAASLPLPTGASTAAKQPVLGTAGTASTDVITVQGIASMTALKVDGSAVTQPVSGTVTANLAAGTNTNEVVGDAAHDAAIAGNPVRIAGRAGSADYTAVANGDTADLLTDLNGKLVVAPYAIPEKLVQGVTAAITGTSATEVLAAGAAGIRNYLTALTVTNSHATVGTLVEIRDGTTTVIFRGYAAPAGGGFSVTFPTPLKGTAATAVNAYNITTGSNTYVSASGYQAP